MKFSPSFYVNAFLVYNKDLMNLEKWVMKDPSSSSTMLLFIFFYECLEE